MSTKKDHLTHSSNNSLSRRNFIKSAAIGSSVVLTATTFSTNSATLDNRNKTQPGNPLTEILSRYGSEFGDIRQTD